MHILEQLLSGRWQDPDTGKYLTFPLKTVVIDVAALELGRLFLERLDVGMHVAVVSDVNTYTVLGERVEQVLSGGFTVTSIVLPDGVKPQDSVVRDVQAQSVLADVLVAVGSGTVNDICKYASYDAGKSYVVFGTAPSMNGYVSANASILMDGFKRSMKAHMPLGVFFDPEILLEAPLSLIRAGLGDVLCRTTSQADWLLSHLWLGTEYRDVPFQWLLGDEALLLAESAGLVGGDRSVMEVLMRSLLLSGLGMVLCGGSYPASQGEHMIAHSMEMVFGSRLPFSYHGEQIAVTTLTMLALQHRLLGQARVLCDGWSDEVGMREFFGDDLAVMCLDEVAEKRALLMDGQDRLDVCWGGVRERLSGVLLDVSQVEGALSAVGAPVSAEALGWDMVQYRRAVQYAKWGRDRVTFLDLQ